MLDCIAFCIAVTTTYETFDFAIKYRLVLASRRKPEAVLFYLTFGCEAGLRAETSVTAEVLRYPQDFGSGLTRPLDFSSLERSDKNEENRHPG